MLGWVDVATGNLGAHVCSKRCSLGSSGSYHVYLGCDAANPGFAPRNAIPHASPQREMQHPQCAIRSTISDHEGAVFSAQDTLEGYEPKSRCQHENSDSASHSLAASAGVCEAGTAKST
mmetsp:Transcript_2097/g.4256  ORF Transcript_2097/g.4256 Transcript_2097/m.4256 type:complete len:119 (+) Transcript_2097:216-572(+)